MNVPFNFRGQVEGLDGGSWIAETFKTIINAISAVWDVQHREDGAHSTVSFGSLTGPSIDFVDSSPEGVVSAPVGSVRLRTNGGTSTSFYVKETGGTGPTGWVAK